MPFAVMDHSPIDVRALEARVAVTAHGAVCTFVGQVRENSRGRQVSYLEYNAYVPMAVKEMTRIAAEAEERWGEGYRNRRECCPWCLLVSPYILSAKSLIIGMRKRCPLTAFMMHMMRTTRNGVSARVSSPSVPTSAGRPMRWRYVWRS